MLASKRIDLGTSLLSIARGYLLGGGYVRNGADDTIGGGLGLQFAHVQDTDMASSRLRDASFIEGANLAQRGDHFRPDGREDARQAWR